MRLLLLCLLFILGNVLNGCDQRSHVYKNEKELVSQINRYYDNLHHPLEFTRAIHVLDTQDKQKTSIHSLGSYLIRKGYSVKRLDTPRHVLDQEMLSVYDVSVEIRYPQDYLTQLPQPLITTEKVWINYETLRIEKIETNDLFISSRSLNYELVQ